MHVSVCIVMLVSVISLNFVWPCFDLVREDKDDVKAATGSLKQERGDGDAVTLTSTATADLMMTPAESSSSMDCTPSAEVKVKLEEDVKEEEISIVSVKKQLTICAALKNICPAKLP